MTEPHPTEGEPAPVPSDLPAPAGEPVTLVDLFLRPTRFFSSGTPYGMQDALVFVAWVVGMNVIVGRIERVMMRAELEQSTSPPAVPDSWVDFWLVVLVGGLIAGMLIWHLGTWWYRVRLRWSGAKDPDVARARTVYLFASLVWAGPAMLWQVIDTFRFPDYLASWNGASPWLLVLMILPFWSVWVAYRGARTAFDTRPGRARWWMLIMPSAVYLIAMGVITALYDRLE